MCMCTVSTPFCRDHAVLYPRAYTTDSFCELVFLDLYSFVHRADLPVGSLAYCCKYFCLVYCILSVFVLRSTTIGLPLCNPFLVWKSFEFNSIQFNSIQFCALQGIVTINFPVLGDWSWTTHSLQGHRHHHLLYQGW